MCIMYVREREREERESERERRQRDRETERREREREGGRGEGEGEMGTVRGRLVLLVILLPQMLLNLHKKSWMDGLQLTDYKEHSANNEKTIKVSTRMPGPIDYAKSTVLLFVCKW